jgi:signal peptidase
MNMPTKRRAIELGVMAAIVGVVVLLPVYTGTSNYPLAIVQGNSMYPTLHSGDLVIFGKPSQAQIANGTIIVFVQGDTGVSTLDSLVRPIVIHRIVGTVIQADGTVYYKTKGDNNQFVDPQLVQSNHVLGVPIRVIPEVGLLVLFVESPEGLVAIIGMVSLFYVGRYEVKLKEDNAKETFLGDLTKLMLEGDVSSETFRRLEPVVKYGRRIQLDGVDDELVMSLLAWLKAGGLDGKWKMENVDCPRCSSRATSFVTPQGKAFALCPSCSSSQASPKGGDEQPRMEERPDRALVE